MVFKSVAEQLATKQKEISISEFFEKNKHILGFDNPTRALLVTVKEGVDNALDATEEADQLPDIYVEIQQVNGGGEEYKVIIEDNGPGIVKKQIPKIFGKLLYGSRFHAIRQSRGQQGIGISAAVLYGQITTGKPTRIMSKISHDEPAYDVELILDTKKNKPNTRKMEVILWEEKDHGTRVEINLIGRYKRGKASVLEYIRETSIVNPHARFTFKEPDGTTSHFERVTEKLPVKCVEIKPHPQGIELGTFINMAKVTQAYRFTSFMVNEFSRVSYRTAREIAKAADIPEDKKPSKLSLEEARAVLDAVQKVKIMAPPTDCLSPIGDVLIRKGLRKEIDSKFAFTVSREPSVFAGTPFQVEVGLVYGGELPAQDSIKIMRFANRVPLLFQQGGCVITNAVEDMNWRQYGFDQPGGSGIPKGPAIILVHVASTNVPFTSEAKEAITHIPEMKSEIQNALRDCARRLKTHIRKKAKLKKVKEKYELIQKVLPEIAVKVSNIVDKPVPDITPVVTQIMNIVYLDSKVEFLKDAGEGVTHAEVYVTNYTPKDKKMQLLCRIPEAMVQGVSPKPSRIDGGFIYWDLPKLEPNRTQTLSFDLLGLDKGDFEECELFYNKTRGEIVGADQA